jgi:threonyl-tRNA synthetase
VSAGKLKLVLQDGSEVEVEHGISARELAERIDGEVAERAIAAKLDDEIIDLARPVERPGSIRFLFEDDDDEDALYVLRHSAAHVLATAVRGLWPNAGIGFGPPIAEGFYYDFDVEQPFTPEDLEKIEARMAEVVAADDSFVRREVERAEAEKLFADDAYKLERLEEIAEADVISVYRDGEFLDLCRGPHLPSTGRVKHFKVLHAAGAYWRGDERRPMLQRIYATSFFEKSHLEEYLRRLEEARKRDHRVLGKELDLFSIQEDVGPGLIHWHPKGAMVQFVLRRFLEDELLRRGYDFVYTPHISRERLFRRSGHLQAYSEVMFPAMEMEGEKDNYRVKPMNCPAHMAIYDARQRSYRDLPVRYAEIASDYRNEKSGTLHGMLRVRGLTMDDAHIFCRPDQVEDEIYAMLDLVDFIYGTFGLRYRLDFATRPAKRIGADEVWDEAEDALKAAIERRGLTYAVDQGGGAFYGPKIDVKFLDAIGLHHPARFRAARALRPQLRRGGQPEAPAGDDPPCHLRHLRALRGRPDRALRRRLPGLARTGAGQGLAGLRRAGRRRPLGPGGLTRSRLAGRARRPVRDPVLPDPRRRVAEDPLPGRGREAGSRCRYRRCTETRVGKEAGRHARGRVRPTASRGEP